MALNRVSIWIILLTLAAPVPIITALLAASEWYSLSHRHELTPLLGAVGLFLMSFIGIAISLWRMVVPFHYTLQEAASSESTQAFLLIGTLLLLPVILFLLGVSGKVRGEMGYH